jgi:hypothetical protein
VSRPRLSEKEKAMSWVLDIEKAALHAVSKRWKKNSLVIH